LLVAATLPVVVMVLVDMASFVAAVSFAVAALAVAVSFAVAA
jgi:hypothetical protein